MMEDLDRFKRRLVRSLSRLLLRERRPPHEVWETLRKGTGKDCQEIWNRMRAITMKKLSRLLAADDYKARLNDVARMTATDWVVYDLMLVHEDIDVIDKDNTLGRHQDKGSALWALMRLALAFNVDSLSGAQLANVWILIAKNYNSAGRECSPMLLQRRWYQLKLTTREKFCQFWANWHGSHALLQNAKKTPPSRLQAVMAKCYPAIVTQPFVDWNESIRRNKVITADVLRNMSTRKTNINMNEPADIEPDVVLMEPKVPTIEIGSDDEIAEDTVTSANTDATSANNDVTSGPLTDGLANIKIVQSTHIPTEVIEASVSEIDSVPINDVSISDGHSNVNDVIVPPDIEDDIITYNANIVTNNTKEIIVEDDHETEIQFIDDGIEIDDCDDGEYLNDDDGNYDKTEEVTTAQIREEFNNSDADSEVAKFDLKLLMTPVVYTTKLDQMSVLANQPHNTVKGDSLIRLISEESKPKLNVEESKSGVEVSVKEEQLKIEPDSEPDEGLDRVSMNSKLFNKPTNVEYNPIKLCKNPDFNTRLKRLNVLFYAYQTNMEYLKQCKPMTVDLSKSFESKLVDNTVYLKRDKSKINGLPVTNLEVPYNKPDINESISKLKQDLAIESIEPKLEIIDHAPEIGLGAEIQNDEMIKQLAAKVVEDEQLNYDVNTTATSNLTIKCLGGNANVKYLEIGMNDEMTKDEIVQIKQEIIPNEVELVEKPVHDPDEHVLKTLSAEDAINEPIATTAPSSTEMRNPRVPGKSNAIAKKKTTPWYAHPVEANKKNRLLAPGSLVTYDTLNKMLKIIWEEEDDSVMIVTSEVGQSTEKETPNIEKDEEVTEDKQDEEKTEGKKRRKRRKKAKPEKPKVVYCCWIREFYTTRDFRSIKAHPCLARPNTECICCCRRNGPVSAATQPPSQSQPEPPPPSTSIDTTNDNSIPLVQEKKTYEHAKKKNTHKNTVPKIKDAPITINIETPHAEVDATKTSDTAENTQRVQLPTLVPALPHSQANVRTRVLYPNTDLSQIALRHAQTSGTPEYTIKITINKAITDRVETNQVVNETVPSEPLAPGSAITKNSDDIINLSDSDDDTNDYINPASKYFQPKPVKKPLRLINKKVVQTPQIAKPFQNELAFLKQLAITSPLNIGDQKVLLTTAKIPDHMYVIATPVASRDERERVFKKWPQDLPPLPDGIQFLLTVDGKATCKVDTTKFDMNSMALLSDLLVKVQKHLNITMIPIVFDDGLAPVPPMLNNLISNPVNDNNVAEIDLTEDGGNTEDMTAETQTSQNQVESVNLKPLTESESDANNSSISDQHNSSMSIKDADTGELLETTSENRAQKVPSNTENESKGTEEPCSDQNEESKTEPLIKIKDFAKVGTTDNNDDPQPVIKKTILSDLMEMSGISADDAVIPEPEAAPVVEPVTTGSPLASLGLTMHSVDGPLTLCPVTSLEILHYARAANGKFFRLDLKTGVIVPTEVAVMQKRTMKAPLPIGTTALALPSTCNIIRSNKPKHTGPTKDVLVVQSKSNIKGYCARMLVSKNTRLPQKIDAAKLKMQRESQYLKKLCSLLKTNNPISSVVNQAEQSKRKPRKEKVAARIDVDSDMEEEYLKSFESSDEDETPSKKPEKRITERDSSESDDEPLSKKAARKETVERQTKAFSVKGLMDEIMSEEEGDPEMDQSSNKPFTLEGVMDEIMSDDENFILGK